MKNASFGQIYCGAISIICLLLLGIVFRAILYNPDVLNNAAAASFLTALSGAIIGALVACYKYITGSTASSQAKDANNADALKQTIQGLANSAPLPPPASSVQAVPAAPEVKVTVNQENNP